MGSVGNDLHLGLCEGDKAWASEGGAADTAGMHEGAGAGARGQDEEINNPLIIQNSEWLQAIGKRLSNYLINC